MDETAGPIPGGVTSSHLHADMKLSLTVGKIIMIKLFTEQALQQKHSRKRLWLISRKMLKATFKKNKTPLKKMACNVQKSSSNLLHICINLAGLIIALFSH